MVGILGSETHRRFREVVLDTVEKYLEIINQPRPIGIRTSVHVLGDGGNFLYQL
jgi:hypothetical protein